MTDKTPEGRKSDTVPLKGSNITGTNTSRLISTDTFELSGIGKEASNMRERAEEIILHFEITPRHCCYKKIIKALAQAEKEGFERGVRECAEIANQQIQVSREFNLGTGTAELIRNNIQRLLPPREKSRIKREGK